MTGRRASLAAYVALVGALVGLVALGSIFATGPAGIAAQVLSVLLMLWARITFGVRSFHAAADPTSGGLVTTGPYRLIRHPIYAAILLFLAAAVASHPSAASVALGLVALAAVAARILAEERLLVGRYPEYATYAARTKRVIPFVL